MFYMKFGGDAITRKCLWTYWRTHVLTYSHTDAGLSPCEISSTNSRAKNAEKVIKNTFRIIKTPHAYLQTILKAPVKFQKDWPKTVGGVEGTRYLLPIHFCSIRVKKMSVKNAKKVIKNNFRILKKPHAYLQTIFKALVKFQKDWPKTVGGVEGTRYLLPIHFCSIRAQKMSKLKMQKKW